jgi:hypothetical protein
MKQRSQAAVTGSVDKFNLTATRSQADVACFAPHGTAASTHDPHATPIVDTTSVPGFAAFIDRAATATSPLAGTRGATSNPELEPRARPVGAAIANLSRCASRTTTISSSLCRRTHMCPYSPSWTRRRLRAGLTGVPRPLPHHSRSIHVARRACSRIQNGGFPPTI